MRAYTKSATIGVAKPFGLIDWTHAMAEPTTPTLPSELPVLPLRRTVAFPLTLQPLAVNRPVLIEAVHRALGAARLVLLLLQENDSDDPAPDDLRRIGTAAIIRQ